MTDAWDFEARRGQVIIPEGVPPTADPDSHCDQAMLERAISRHYRWRWPILAVWAGLAIWCLAWFIALLVINLGARP